jgi:DNA-directed RNA polymerase subunit F
MAAGHLEQIIYVDLDSILDTRLGTLAKMNQQVAADVLNNGYHHRKTDIFKGVDRALYLKMYAERDEETLKHSFLTNIGKHLRTTVIQVLAQAMTMPHKQEIQLLVNTYPYQMTPEVMQELQSVVSEMMGHLCKVKIEYIPLKDLTPMSVKQNVIMMVMYHFEEWINTNIKGFAAMPAPVLTDVVLFAPALYNEELTDLQIAGTTRKAMHPFEAVITSLLPLIHLEFLDPWYFSVLSDSR